ncbi:SGNH/GDSL hydrolase family protein [Actinoplanes sp. GCM10030250]|uniref:SGNH/GDSL hydrolase family protein n=1 Tax=Actinoplanes sp. GCM10030250 TaxID=3273376 RepID=UPI003611B956
MKRAWVFVAAAMAVAVAGCSGSDAGDAPPPAARDYVALGDSYASGLGAGNYLNTECFQSKDSSYPQLWVKSRPAGTLGTVTDRTCSGALIKNVRDTQLDAINADTGWVTLTVGGNDAGWVGALRQCLLGNDQTCRSTVTRSASDAEAILPDELDKLYTAIRKRAPDAKVYVLGYPHLVGAGTGAGCESLPESRREILNEGSDKLAETIKAAVGKHEGFTYVDVRKAFEGHEACTGSPWIHSVRDELSESFHPNAEGFQAYAKALAEVTG